MPTDQKNWYIHKEKERKTYGPYSLSELKQLIESGHVEGLDKAAQKGGTWQAAYSVPELSQLFVHRKPKTTPLPQTNTTGSMAFSESEKKAVFDVEKYKKPVGIAVGAVFILLFFVFVFTRPQVLGFLKNILGKKSQEIQIADVPLTGTPEEHVIKARAFAKSRDPQGFASAENEYKLALRLNGSYEPALTGLAWLYYEWAGIEKNPARLQDAIKFADETIKINPRNADAYTVFAFTYNELNKSEESLKNAEIAYSIRQDDWRITYLIANFYIRDTARRTESEEFFEKTVKINPEQFESHKQLAVMYEEDKRYEDTVVHLEKLAQLKPTEAGFFYSLGLNYARIERIKNAVEAYKKCIGLLPDHLDARINLSRLLFEKVEDYDDAMKNIETLLSGYAKQLSDFDRKFFSVALGRIYLAKERFDDAIKAFQDVLNADKDHIEAHFYLGDAYFAKGIFHDAEREYREVLRLSPNSAAVRLSLARVMDNLARRDLAIDELNTVLKIDPSFAEAHYLLGVYRDKDGYYYEAMDFYKNAIKHKPDYIEAHYALAQDALKLGETKLAINEFTAVKEIDSNYEDVLYYLAEAYFADGNVKSAVREYKQYKRDNPKGRFKDVVEKKLRHYR